AGDVLEMRKAIAAEKGDGERWNLKYVAGGLIDIEFIAQYLQLVHAAQTPIFSTLPPRRCSIGHGGSGYLRARKPRGWAERCASIMISRRFCAYACQGSSIPRRRRRASADC